MMDREGSNNVAVDEGDNIPAGWLGCGQSSGFNSNKTGNCYRWYRPSCLAPLSFRRVEEDREGREVICISVFILETGAEAGKVCAVFPPCVVERSRFVSDWQKQNTQYRSLTA